ncbi:MAG: hypothetical protein ACREMY_25525 [bacterium]
MTLNVPNAADLAARATFNGTVFRDDPFNPTRLTPVAGAGVTINDFASVTAGPDDKFTYEGIPLALAGRKVVTAFNPSTPGGWIRAASATQRRECDRAGDSSTQPSGVGTMRVRPAGGLSAGKGCSSQVSPIPISRS